MAWRMDIFTKAAELGIQTEFLDGQGHRHVTDAAALKIILDALPEHVPYRLVHGPIVLRSGRASQTELRPTAALPVPGRSPPDPQASPRAKYRSLSSPGPPI